MTRTPSHPRASAPHPLAQIVASLAPLGPVIVSFDRASGRIEARVEVPRSACGDDSDRQLGEDGASRTPRRR